MCTISRKFRRIYISSPRTSSMQSFWEKVTGPLVANGNISKEDEGVYQYAVKSIFILGANVLISLLIGIVMDEPWYCMLFLLALIPLRSDAGGYHAPNMPVCYLLSFASLIFTLLGVKDIQLFPRISIVIVAFLSTLLIFTYAPLESKNRPLTDREKTSIGKRARMIVCVEMVLGMVLLFVNRKAAFAISSAIFWCAVGYVAWFVEKKILREK